MRKKMIMLAAMALVIFSLAAVANATIFSSKYIYDCYANCKAISGGITISIDITATDTMSVLGAQTIIVQERASSSSSWTSIDTLSSDDYDNMLITNSRKHNANINYYGTTPGYQYRAKVYFYAEKGGYDTHEFITAGVTAK